VGFFLLPEGIHRSVRLLLSCPRAASAHDARPGFIGLRQRNGIGVARSAVGRPRASSGHSVTVRSAHDERARRRRAMHRPRGYALAIMRVMAPIPPVRFSDRAHIATNSGIGHRLRVAVDQQYFVPAGVRDLQQKHPKVRHEVFGVTPLSGLYSRIFKGRIPVPLSPAKWHRIVIRRAQPGSADRCG